MKYNFNDDNLVIGYIKELLKEFNLPKCKVYKEGITRLYPDRNYIKDDYLVRCNGDKALESVRFYTYNDPIPNITRNLVINSSIYDTYTHYYLGDYLRFLRDYKNLNLMPLYNCFGGELPISLFYAVGISDTVSFNIDTDDDRYVYYIVPVKFGEKYTIAIDAQVPYEMACILYTGDKVLSLSRKLTAETYKKISGSSFRNPIIYSTDIDANKYWMYEDNLRLMIKLPKVVNSAISILEGNYLTSTQICGPHLTSQYIYQGIKGDYPTKLSLLSYNTKTSHPFADRLVEYLFGSAITNLESIPNNIQRVQNRIYNNLDFGNEIFHGIADIWDDHIRYKLYEIENIKKKQSFAKIYDIGNPEIEIELTDYDKLKYIDIYQDLLAYADKDMASIIGVK